MPEQSFAIDPGQFAEGRATDAPAALRLTESGSSALVNAGFSGGGVDTSQSDRTYAAIAKLGSELLAPLVQAESQRQFMSGVQKAMTGTALKEIVDEQPAFTRIFGPSSATIGAQTYAVGRSIAEFAAEAEAQMPRFAEQGPQALNNFISGKLKSLMTGDPVTDAAIAKDVISQTAPLYKRQAREQYILTQKTANANQRADWLGRVELADRALGDATATPEDREGIVANLVSSFVKFGDQTDASHGENMVQVLQAAAAKGNFHAINALEQQGLLAALPVEQQDNVQRALRQGAARRLGLASKDYAEETAVLLQRSDLTPKELAAKLDDLNERASKATGVGLQYGQIIPFDRYDTAIGGLLRDQAATSRRAASAAASAAEKEAAQQQENALHDSLLLTPGGFDGAIANGFAKTTDFERAATRYIASKGGTPEAFAQVANANPDRKVNEVSRLFTHSTLAPEVGATFERSAAVFALMNNAAKAKHLTDEQIVRYSNYNASVAAKVPEAAAYISDIKGVIPAVPPSTNPEKLKTIESAVNSKYASIFPGSGMYPQGSRIFTALALKSYDTLLAGADPDAAAEVAVDRATQFGARAYGRYGYMQVPGGQYAEMKNGPLKIAAKDSEINDSFSEYVQDTAAKLGLDHKELEIVRLPDSAETGVHFLFRGVNDDGKVLAFRLTGNQLRAAAESKSRGAVAPAATTAPGNPLGTALPVVP